MDRSQAWRVLATMAGSWVLQGFGMFSVIEKSSGQWIGRLGPWHPEGWPGSEVGWGLVVQAWGRGFAGEGSAAAMDWAFEALGWTNVIHVIDPANEPSKAVARRLGSAFLRIGEVPGPLAGKPLEIWGQDRDQWRSRQLGGRK
jgi:RimJ/RimL family protein N-acetyltransferase